MYQTFSFQGLLKYTKIEIYGMQIYHLAKLAEKTIFSYTYGGSVCINCSLTNNAQLGIFDTTALQWMYLGM
jgi:hypothetical protein